MKLKVLAYLTRHHNRQTQLLVFEHRDYPEAGTQVPAGTVEPNEDVQTALFREVAEESGLPPARLKVICKLGEFENRERRTIQHVFHLTVSEQTPDKWSHTVGGAGEDGGLVFNYYWVDLKHGIELAGNQHEWVGLIAGY
jgi:ADP-ribose pyrophosphatase YjhB (NUDIX family)